MTTSIQPIFQAKWPESLDPASKPAFEKVTKLFQKALYYLLFPITFTWSLFRNLAWRFIVPGASHIPLSDLSNWSNHLLRYYGGEKIHIKTPDGIQIEGAFFEKKGSDRVVIYSGANHSQWELQSRWLDILKPLDVSIMLLNPRGIGSSSGIRSPEGWALDFYTACEYLYNEKGYDPERVLPLGFSMGGAMAARGAAVVQEKYPMKKIPAMNLCSFSDLRKEIDAILPGMLGLIGKMAVGLLGINMPVKSSWDTLKGKKVVMYKPHDEIIAFSASMANSIKDHNATQVIALEPDLDHNAPFTRAETALIQGEVCRILDLMPPGHIAHAN